MADFHADSVGDTVGALFLHVERVHDRAAALRHWTRTGPEDTPDWRFHRHAIRIALYLSERLNVGADTTVALLSPVGPAWALACWATLAYGATLLLPSPEAADGDLLSAWAREKPRVAFVGDSGLPPGIPPASCAVVSTGAEPLDGALGVDAVLDLGGTLDTAERANAFRARAREIDPGRQALLQAGARTDRAPPLTQRDVANLVRERWKVTTPRRGDDVPFASSPASLESVLSLLACIAGGRASAVFS